jgi:hypothetical protein
MSSWAGKFHVLSLIPGRVRLHFPNWSTGGVDQIEDRLGRVPGVQSVEANRLTGNVLIHFDPRISDANKLLMDLQKEWDQLRPAVPSLPVPGEGRGQRAEGAPTSRWIRVGVGGLLGHAVVDSLWFGAGFLGSAVGLPLAGLGPLHVLMDIAVWGMALGSANGPSLALHPKMDRS